jgi:neutral ceramidase
MKRFCLGVLVAGFLFAGGCVVVVGPWPTYGPSPMERLDNYQAALALVDERIALNNITGNPGRLQAGWAAVELTPPIGIPLAGYGNRGGAPSTGVHDPLFVKALAVSDGVDTAIIVGADMLIISDNIAHPVRERVAAATGLDENAILFNATHTHSGPGGAMPGLLANAFAGGYDPTVPELAIRVFSEAIIAAHAAMAPARMAHGMVEVPEHIRNRARSDSRIGHDTDPSLHYLVVEQEDGDRCIVVRYSAHSTVIGGSNMEFSGDYPGYVQRIMTEETGAECIFLAGAMGSMSASNTGEGDGFQRSENLGRSLVSRVLPALENLSFEENVQVAAVGVPIYFPSYQIRLNKGLRLSPKLPPLAGLGDEGWVHGVRLGDVVMIGIPADYSGELAVGMRQWADAVLGVSLWMNSFSGSYIGYVSPDEYYFDPWDLEDSREANRARYEIQVMSWTGPQQEAIFDGLSMHIARGLMGAN